MKRIVNISNTYIFIIALLLVAPFLQRSFKLFDFESLKGWRGSNPVPSITSDAWFTAEYQKKFDSYSSDSFGFAPWLVRNANQLDYDLFKTANAQYVVVGDSNYLYETAYIEAEMGMDYVGVDSIRKNCRKLKYIAQELSKKKVELLVVMAPGKASFFPEFIPDYYNRYKGDSTNYGTYVEELLQHDIPLIDMNAWFRDMKTTSRFNLFPQTGIHWSTYGMALAGDSIQKYLSNRFNERLPRYRITGDEVSLEMRKSDQDVEDGMNLKRKLNHLPMYYPEISFDTAGTKKLRTAMVADSYFWGLYDHGFSSLASDSGEFWYYFNDIYPQNFTNGLTSDNMNLLSAMEKQDAIILLGTDGTLPRFGWGFIESAYTVLKEN